MKKILISIVAPCLFVLLACHKDSSKPPVTTDSTTTGKLKINFITGSWASQTTTPINCELIISEPGGKILLDTVMPNYANLNATLSTNATLVDITNIGFDSYLKKYTIVTYKAANPTNWTSDYNFGELAPTPVPKPTAQDTVVYQHLPPNLGPNNVTFSENTYNGYLIESNGPNTVKVTYSGLPGNYAYFLCNNQNLYKFYLPKSSNDTVDCTIMDTAVAANYNSSPNYAYQYTSLYGYTDSNNRNSILQLYFDIQQTFSPYQLIYPSKYFQKFQLFKGFQNNSGEQLNYYNGGSSVNSTVVYPDPNAYTISSSTNSNFFIKFNTVTPAYYYTKWSDANVNYYINASPDSTTINPVGLVTSLKSKLLQGKNLSDLSLSSFQYQVVPGYNYAAYLSLSCDSALLNKTEVGSYMIYTKTF